MFSICPLCEHISPIVVLASDVLDSELGKSQCPPLRLMDNFLGHISVKARRWEHVDYVLVVSGRGDFLTCSQEVRETYKTCSDCMELLLRRGPSYQCILERIRYKIYLLMNPVKWGNHAGLNVRLRNFSWNTGPLFVRGVSKQAESLRNNRCRELHSVFNCADKMLKWIIFTVSPLRDQAIEELVLFSCFVHLSLLFEQLLKRLDKLRKTRDRGSHLISSTNHLH